MRDVWHADPRISVSADELDQLRNLVRDRKFKRNGKGAAWADTLGFMERVAAIEAKLRELRTPISYCLIKASDSCGNRGFGFAINQARVVVARPAPAARGPLRM